jgi:cytochrome P450
MEKLMEQHGAVDATATSDGLLPWRDPEFIRAPWPWFDRVLRDHPLFELSDGTFVVSRYHDVMTYAKDRSLVSVPPEGMGDDPWAANENSVLLTEGERHSRIRRTFSGWLTPKAVRTWAETAARTAKEALDRIEDDGLIDAHRNLGVQPAQDAMAHALGVEREDGFPYIRATNQTMVAMGWQPTDDEVVRAREGFGFMMFQAERLIAEKRHNPGDGMLLDTMIRAADEGQLTERELKESIQILWGSAAHNPGHHVSSALVDFANNPHAFTAYKKDPGVREAILNETIRRALPEVLLDRFTTAPLEIHGVTIPSGAKIRFILGAALRDPDVFRNPDEFDWERPKEASMALAFGVGTHNCAGQAIARATATAVLDVITERFERVEVVGEPDWVFSDRHRNCEGLTVRLS